MGYWSLLNLTYVIVSIITASTLMLLVALSIQLSSMWHIIAQQKSVGRLWWCAPFVSIVPC